MKPSVWIGVVLCLSLAPALAAAELDEIIAKNLEARGGLEKLRSVETVRVTGTMMMGPTEAPFEWVWKRPNKFRVEFEFQGMTGISAFDGETGWRVMPFTGSTDPEPMSEEELKQVEQQADFDGPLIDTEEKGYTVEYLGEEETEGTPAHKLKVTDKHGEETLLFLDAEYFLQIRAEGKRTRRGQEIEFESSQGDFKEVEGLMLAHSIESKAKDAPAGQMMTFETVELNVEVPDDRFVMPEKTEADEAEAEQAGSADPR